MVTNPNLVNAMKWEVVRYRISETHTGFRERISKPRPQDPKDGVSSRSIEITSNNYSGC